jgi:thioredoxin-like negative regulator of GroEL
MCDAVRKALKTVSVAAFAALFAAHPAISQISEDAVEGPWLSSVDEALELAAATDRHLLVDLWAEWCTWCKKLEENVFSTPTFLSYADRYVLLRVDTEDGDEGTRLKERFEIHSLPTTLILSHEMVKVGELQGYLEAEQYVQSLELERMMYHLLIRAFDESDGKSDAETLKMMADDFHSRRDGVRAATLYRKVLVAGEVDPDEAAWNRYLLADSLRLQGAASEAQQAQIEARRAAIEVDNPKLVELNDLLPYQIARDDLQCDTAEKHLVTFLEEHPAGQYRALAEKALRSIRKDRTCA